MKQLIIATKNRGKLNEIRALAAPLNIEVRSLADLPQPIDVVEDADSFEGNAIKKADTVAQLYHCPTLADDSGLVVDALDGRPLIASAACERVANDYGQSRRPPTGMADFFAVRFIVELVTIRVVNEPGQR